MNKEYIANLSRRNKMRLALSMVVPIRCGGCHYEPDGTEVLMIGGKWIARSELEDLRRADTERRMKEVAVLDQMTDEEYDLKFPIE